MIVMEVVTVPGSMTGAREVMVIDAGGPDSASAPDVHWLASRGLPAVTP
jgi:hypothetical protein